MYQNAGASHGGGNRDFCIADTNTRREAFVTSFGLSAGGNNILVRDTTARASSKLRMLAGSGWAAMQTMIGGIERKSEDATAQGSVMPSFLASARGSMAWVNAMSGLTIPARTRSSICESIWEPSKL